MIINYIKNFIIFTLIFLIRIYQIILSPILITNCRYLPTCSEYSITALKKYGFIKGSCYALFRILKCHPLGGHGYDPVPKRLKKEI